jgi:methylphosphotriester-DNA--protein-cysteine methyltransferase
MKSEFFGKRRPIQSEHEEFLRSSVASHFSYPLTVYDMQNKVRASFASLPTVSSSTLRRCLKSRLGMTYKNIGRQTPIQIQPGKSKEGLVQIAFEEAG